MIRDATTADLPAILAITNQAILTGTALWVSTPMTLAMRTGWMADRHEARQPVLVAEQDGAVAGFGAYGPFRPHEGFSHTVEHSLYVDPSAQRRGHGRALLDALVSHARAAGLHAMIGGIAAENAASIALHQAAGFSIAGTLPQTGTKFGRWLDLVFLHRLLD